MSEKSYEVYQAAGELYGRLLEQLDTGKLILYRDHNVYGRNFGYVVEWRVDEGGHYGAKWFVSDIELLHIESLAELADRIAEQWIAGYRDSVELSRVTSESPVRNNDDRA